MNHSVATCVSQSYRPLLLSRTADISVTGAKMPRNVLNGADVDWWIVCRVEQSSRSPQVRYKGWQTEELRHIPRYLRLASFNMASLMGCFWDAGPQDGRQHSTSSRRLLMTVQSVRWQNDEAISRIARYRSQTHISAARQRCVSFKQRRWLRFIYFRSRWVSEAGLSIPPWLSYRCWGVRERFGDLCLTSIVNESNISFCLVLCHFLLSMTFFKIKFTI